jgi:hypothetical protein
MRSRWPRAASVSFLLAIASVDVGASPPSFDPLGSGIARSLFEEARSLAESGDWASASPLLAEARAQDGGDSDIRFYSALVSRSMGAPLGDSLAELDAALASDRFSEYREDEARLMKAELLVVLRRWQEALSILGGSSPEPDLEGRWMLARAKAFLGSGAESSCAAELERALRRRPDDPAFARFVFSAAASGARALPDSRALRSLVELAMSRVERCAPYDPELPVLAAPFMLDRDAAANAVLAFRASGGKSPAATLLALEYGLADESSAAAELFSGSYALRSGDFARAHELTRSPAGRAAFADALAAYAGRIETDRDGDGVVDWVSVLSKGQPIFFSFDADQDGSSDLTLSFTDGLPSSAELGQAGLSFGYGEYPALETARATGGEVEVVFNLEPGTLHYRPVLMSPVAGEGRGAVLLPEPTGEPAPTERAIVSSALSRRERRGEIEELLYLDRGVSLRREILKKGQLALVTEYRLGLPSVERADLDGDGRFETERGYAAAESGTGPAAAAELAWARVDSDGDGLFEYREETRFPFRKEWDLDANGSVDAVENRTQDGSLLCEYSSRLDGSFDERLVLRGGEIAGFSKNGIPVALVPDANPAYVWIGSKPFDIGMDEPPSPGLHSRGGRRYRIVRGDRRFFAELLP